MPANAYGPLVDKYLKHHAEPGLSLACLDQVWQRVICIPAYDEAELLPGLIDRLAQETNLLCILVCNCPDSSCTSDADMRTRQLAANLRRQFSVSLELNPQSSLLAINQQGSHLLLLEHYGLPASQGVGLARKIACDLACQLIAAGKIQNPWIYNTDADVSLPGDYFHAQPDEAAAAAIYPFQHAPNPDPKLQQGLQLYDLGLHYYLAGLRWANSPYAFYTIGSTLLINYRHYAIARGFPKRSGGEDFYLLNKLAKLGKIQQLDGSPIILSGRTSQRAPFGTGAALSKFCESAADSTAYRYYHPGCFVALKNFLDKQPELQKSTNWQTLLEDEKLAVCLKKLGLDAALDHARSHSKSSESFLKHLRNWFDAFRTLKLIHLLRDKAHPSISYAALQELKTEYEFIETVFQLAPPVN